MRRSPSKPTAGQVWNAKDYAGHAGFVPALGEAVLALLAPKPGERILDLGWGDGVLTTALIKAGASVVGVDASPHLIEAAQSRGIDARLMDGQKLSFDKEFDAVFSSATLHWMKDWRGVLKGVSKALKPSGRFVAEFWRPW